MFNYNNGYIGSKMSIRASNAYEEGLKPYTNELQVIKRYETFYDFVFVLAHELRHKYQIDNGWDFSNYIQRDKTDLITYNLQVQELDANAYGFIFMVNEFGVKPLFKGMDEQIKNAIMERVEYLIKTEYI